MRDRLETEEERLERFHPCDHKPRRVRVVVETLQHTPPAVALRIRVRRRALVGGQRVERARRRVKCRARIGARLVHDRQARSDLAVLVEREE